MSLLELDQVTKEYPLSGKKRFWERGERFDAVKQVSLQLNRGESLGIVGENGSGKSTLAKLIMNLEPVTAGDIRLGGYSIQQMKDRNVFKHIQLVLQDSHSVLHPKMSIREIIQEPLYNFYPKDKKQWESKWFYFAEMVGISKDLLNRYPHELSGGQKQRVCIARSLAVQPDIIIFDESLASIDPRARQFILNSLACIQKTEKVAYVFITHDLETIKGVCHRTAVMYQGEIVDIFERWNVSELNHPYSRLLLETVEVAESV
ncbi:ABC transporter ATP-binding protein [Bacillus sp. FJAT-44742]|uniref:ABC transporter ATP-binding protein n=1 Tax=Bacillus sp. FJAT-44742 TaxID=2014005 RepID=UPI000C241006|nr:dipeptide/oligopeptide/nickel ABC transporter ATP-binding protein [Bacillus sp. FJAT-44742]